MNAGLLKHRIAILKKDIVTDDEGQQTKSWTDYTTAKAYVNGLSGKEYWEALAQQAENTVVFTVRFTQKINAITPQDHKIIFGGKEYDIKHIDNVQYKNEFVKIKAVAKNG